MEFLRAFFGTAGFLPHGYCFTWTPGLLWSMVGADAVIAAAYFSIPAAILSFVRKRGDHGINGVAFLFSAFIFSCGITHVMDVWTIWQPAYGVQALTKTVTAAISIVTAFALWPLIPVAVKLPSVLTLQSVIASLEAEIEKRHQAEDQVVDIQQSLAVALASIGAGFIATDREGRVTRMNVVAERITGWTQHDATGQDIWRVFERESRPDAFLLKNAVDVMIEQGLTVDVVHRVVAVSRDGRRTVVDVQSDLTRSGDGTVLGLAMVLRDMTSVLGTEAELKRLAAIVASSGDAIIGKTLDGRITSWNRAAEDLFGYSASEAIGQPIQMLIPVDRQDEEMRILAQVARGQSVSAFDTVRLKRGDRPVDVSITISPIRDGEGRVIGASKIARDVSVQRRAEAALRASEERLRFTLESAQLGDWELDLATGVAQHSLRHDRCFGYSSPQTGWNVDKFIGHVHPDDRAEVGLSLQAAVSEVHDWRTQCRVIWPDGSEHWISAHGGVQSDGGKATRMLGIVSEITEQRQAEEARLKAQRLEAENRQIQEANRIKSQFVANMSHELRTPLNAVIGFADLLHSGFVKPDSPKHQEFLGHIGTSGRHLLQLINDVLDLSKVESGKFEFLAAPLDLHAVFKEVKDILHTAIQRKSITIRTEIDPDLAALTLDAARLKQVLYNYLSNAIKFTAAGGSVTVRAAGEGPAHFRIEVEDNGIGISPANLSRLFSEFQQLDAGYSKQHQGTGLGLALTRRLVEAQGGEVGVRSIVGVGSVFYLVLNRSHGDDLRRAENAAHDTRAAEMKRVLVIEDDQRDQARLIDAFADAGFEVDAAATGSPAMRKARDKAAVFAIENVLCKPLRSDEILAAMARFRLPDASRANVVVIDDDQASLDLMRSTLKRIGIDAVCFLDGRVALHQMDRLRPDAIVLDLMMPGFDGFQVLAGLHELPAWRDVPVFIWTSMLLTDEEYAGLARSARAILTSGGVAMEDMLASVRGWRPPGAERGADQQLPATT